MIKKPIVFLDFESTGTDVAKDRIVQIATVKFDEGFQQVGTFRNMIVNPTIPIPEQATKVHGITNEMVAGKPRFIDYAKSFREYLDGCILVAHNGIAFDFPLLSQEFFRSGIIYPTAETLMLDTKKVMEKKLPRTLEGAAQFYCGRSVENAHDAFADTTALVDVFRGQLSHYPDLREMSEVDFSNFCRGENILDLSGKFRLDEKGVAIYNFGKHEGESVRSQKYYAEKWMLDPEKSSFTEETRRVLREILNHSSDVFRQPKISDNG